MHICLFDIDGTLISTGGAGTAALRAALQSDFGIADPTDSVPVHGRTDRGITRDLFQFHGIDDLPEHWDRFRAAYLRHLPLLLRDRPGAVLPGIVSLLEQLQARDNVVLGLLTGNTREGARIKLAHYGLDRFFSFGGFGDQHYERNDVAREALAVAQSRHPDRVDVSRVWVIGDTPFDVRCGRAIGARAIAVATGNHTREELSAEAPDHLATDLADHESLFALWK